MAILYCWSGAAGSGSGADWTNAKTTLAAAFTTEVAGDTIYIAHDHVELTAVVGLASSGTVALPTKVICVNRAGSVPPVSADRRTTAQVSRSGDIGLDFNGCTHYDGIIFTAGNSTGAAVVNLASLSNLWSRFDNCSLRIGSTGAGRFRIGSANGSYTELNNTTLSFSATTQTIDIETKLKWRNTPSALIGAAVPATLFTPVASDGGQVECLGVDLSAAGSGKTLVGAVTSALAISVKFVDCKLDAAVTKSTVPATHGSTEIDFIRCAASGVNYTVHRHRITGLLTEEITIVRTTGGASDGTTPLSWKVVTTANCNYSMPFECPPIAIWNDTTGSSVTATVEGIWGGGATPLDTECWLECEYLGSSSSPLGSFVADCAADLLTAGANQTSSSETWGGSTTAFKLSCTFTPQMKGWCYCRVKVGRASSTFYVDPLCVLS